MIIILLSISLTATISNADCAEDLQTCRANGRAVIDAANKTIAARDLQIKDQANEIDHLTNSLSITTTDLNNTRSALDSWYHNPVILTLLGAVVGGAGVVILQHR